MGLSLFQNIGQSGKPQSSRGGGMGQSARKFQKQYAASAALRTKALERQRRLTLKAGRASFKRARGELKRVGGAARERIGMSRERRLASSEQDLIGRGMGSTTIRGSARRGIESDIGREQRGLDEMLSGQRAGLEERSGMFELNAGQFGLQSMGMEPNMSEFMRMLAQMGQY